MSSEREILLRLFETNPTEESEGFEVKGHRWEYKGFNHYYCDGKPTDKRSYHMARDEYDSMLAEPQVKNYKDPYTTGKVISRYKESLKWLDYMEVPDSPINNPTSTKTCYKSALENVLYFTTNNKSCKLCFGYTWSKSGETIKPNRVQHVWVKDDQDNIYETNRKFDHRYETHSLDIEPNLSRKGLKDLLNKDLNDWNKDLLN